ncbi:DUF2771 domain-containing protein [Streptomyces colonosanans]|uniref:DUF2771 domain-containing protein n=1 Tax=Streptomyces colonosanans TaxID=1428652 RepID=A0A1S2PS48_9ACTN|nr:DUF2771 domain-containing protein [Streptomyces colonosanans]OIJ96637.1 DUF2771 domain-containing protein [Streptomyces colonosanans]
MTALPSRRAVAVLGAVSAGLLLLSACDKPTPMATITVGSNSVSSQAGRDCYNDGKTVSTEMLVKCLKSKDVKSITVDPDATVRFGVDPDIADKGWTILMNGQPLTDSSNKTYRTIPGSVFFNAQYGASGNSTLVSVKAGENTVTGLWSFKLKKGS